MALAFNGFFSFNLSFQGARELQSPISPHFSEMPSFAAFLCGNFSQKSLSWTPWMRGLCLQFMHKQYPNTLTSALALENQKAWENFVWIFQCIQLYDKGARQNFSII